MMISTLTPLITDDIDKFSMLTWSTSRYRVLRDLPTFGLITNKSRSWGNIGNVACSVTPSAIYPLDSLRHPWKIPEQNSHVLVCHSPLLDHQTRELRGLSHGRTTFDTPCILQPEVQIALLPSLSPIRRPWHHMSNCIQLGRWKHGIAGVQHEIKRFGRTPNEIGPPLAS